MLKLTGNSMPSNRGQNSGHSAPSSVSSTSSRILKTSQDLNTLKDIVKRKVEESLDDIIEETAG